MGALWGTLVGLLFLNPLAGMVIGAAVGAGSGALSGSLTDYGINDDFVRKLGETIPVDSSALFVLVKSVTEDKSTGRKGALQTFIFYLKTVKRGNQ